MSKLDERTKAEVADLKTTTTKNQIYPADDEFLKVMS